MQVTVQQHMNQIYYSERNKLLYENNPMHLNQQLAALLKRFCTKLLGDSKEFNPEFFLALLHVFYWHLKISGALLLVIFVGI